MSQLPPPGGDRRRSISGCRTPRVTTTGDSASWLPPPAPARPATPQQHSPTAPRQQRRRVEGAAGGILAGLFAFLKYGLFLVKFGTFGPTLITMVIAIWFYTLFFGPAFAVGIVVLILDRTSSGISSSRDGWDSRPVFRSSSARSARSPICAVLPRTQASPGSSRSRVPRSARSQRCSASCSPASPSRILPLSAPGARVSSAVSST